jgi:hypothetical protein
MTGKSQDSVQGMFYRSVSENIASAGPAFVGNGPANRDRQVDGRQHIQLEIELAAYVADGAADRTSVRLIHQSAGTRSPVASVIETRGAGTPEVKRRQIPFRD